MTATTLSQFSLGVWSPLTAPTCLPAHHRSIHSTTSHVTPSRPPVGSRHYTTLRTVRQRRESSSRLYRQTLLRLSVLYLPPPARLRNRCTVQYSTVQTGHQPARHRALAPQLVIIYWRYQYFDNINVLTIPIYWRGRLRYMRYEIHQSFISSFIIFDKFMQNSLNFMIPIFFYFTLFSSIKYFIRDRKSSSPHHHLVKDLIQPSRQTLIPSHSPLSLLGNSFC